MPPMQYSKSEEGTVMNSSFDGERTLTNFDEYGFLIPTEDQNGLESRSHDYGYAERPERGRL